MAKKIRLSGINGKGKYCVVDDDIFERYGELRWYLSDTGYAVRRNNHKTERLHRLVMNCPREMIIDHRNGDKLDNRRCNLRICTQEENAKNYHGTVGYCFDKSRGKWIVKYRKKFYGRYDTEEEAKRAYQLAKSGVEYKKTRRKYYMLPKHISRQFGVFKAGIQKNGVRYRKSGFSTLEEAISWRDKKLAELRIKP